MGDSINTGANRFDAASYIVTFITFRLARQKSIKVVGDVPLVVLLLSNKKFYYVFGATTFFLFSM